MTRPPTWITVAILELIHAYEAPTPVERALLLVQNQSPFVFGRAVSPLVTLDNFVLIAWPLRWRRIFQMSALSNVDGT